MSGISALRTNTGHVFRVFLFPIFFKFLTASKAPWHYANQCTVQFPLEKDIIKCGLCCLVQKISCLKCLHPRCPMLLRFVRISSIYCIYFLSLIYLIIYDSFGPLSLNSYLESVRKFPYPIVLFENRLSTWSSNPRNSGTRLFCVSLPQARPATCPAVCFSSIVLPSADADVSRWVVWW